MTSFSKGMKVVTTSEWFLSLHRKPKTGTVLFTPTQNKSVGIVLDGQKTPQYYAQNFWEPLVTGPTKESHD